MTINQILNKAHKDQSHITLFIDNIEYQFDNAIVTRLTRTEITFLSPAYHPDGTCLIEYTFDRTLIVGVGRVVARFNTDNKLPPDTFML